MADQRVGQFDRWREAASIAEAQARELAAFIELRGKAADEIAARAAYLDLLGIEPGDRVLEAGCGSGVVLRDIARRVGAGRAVGVDPNPYFLRIARELAESAGLAEWIELRQGDVRALPAEDGEFDLALAVTVLSHVPDGERGIPELVRATRAGGRVGVFDRDVDSFIVAHPDRALTRRIVTGFSDYGATDGWLARRLPGLLRDAGLREVRVRAFTSLEQDPNGFYAATAARRARTVAEAGLITASECERWLAQFEEEQRAGRFLAGATHLFAWGTRS